MTSLSGYDVVREAYYRRNVIVHNKGITDNRYCARIPNTKTGARLTTNAQYVRDVITATGKFIDALDNCFSTKIHYDKDPLANRMLHPEAMLSLEDIGDNSPG